MSDLEDLPSWAGRSADEPTAASAPAAATAGPAPAGSGPVVGGPAPAPAGPPPRRRWLLALSGLLLLAAGIVIGALAFLVLDGDSSDTEATGGALASDEVAEDDATDGVDETDEAATGETGTATGDGTTTDGQATGDDTATDDGDATAGDDAEASGSDDTDDTATEDTASDGTGDEMAMSGRTAVLRGGKVYLSGAVPSEEIGALIVERVAAVIGPDNVVNEYTIDPTVTINPGENTPLFVEEVVLFEFNSVEINPAFAPLLELGVALLTQNPQASITVVARTDAAGSEEVNLEVATKRGQAIRDYWVSRGVDPDQVEIDARGEEGTSESDDDATAATQRRAEFVVTNILG